MRNLFLLVKNYFLCFLGSFMKKKEKARYSTAIILMLLFGGLFIFTFGNMAVMTITVSLEYEASIGAPLIAESALMSSSLLALMCSILTIFTKASLPSKSTDEQLLLSLPVKKITIIGSKLVYNYLFDFMLFAFTLMPTYVVYSYLVPGANFLIVLRGLLIVGLLPLIVNALSTFIGYLLSFITRGYRLGKAVQSMIVVIAMILFLVGYYAVMLMNENNAISSNPFFQNFPFVKWIINFSIMNQNGLMSIIYLSSISIVLFIFGVLIQASLLGKERDYLKSNKKNLEFKESKVFKALFKKELSYYFSVPLYVVNTLLFGLFAVIISIVLAVMGKESILNLLSQAEMTVEGMDKIINYLIILIVSIMIGTLCTTAPSISLEGKRLWILKVHPVSEMEVFLSKILVNVLISGICSVLTSIAIGFTIGFEYTPILLILLILISLMISMIGIIGNLYYPNFEWDNEQVPIKQGVSVLIGMGFGFLGVVIPFGIGISFVLIGIKDIIVLLLLIGIYIIIDLIVYFILKTKGTKLFRKL